jgi:hypothetical protein
VVTREKNSSGARGSKNEAANAALSNKKISISWSTGMNGTEHSNVAVNCPGHNYASAERSEKR